MALRKISLPLITPKFLPMISENKKTFTDDQLKMLPGILKKRFEENMNRHEGLDWTEVEARLKKLPHKTNSLLEMENTGGEPDVIAFDTATGEYLFCDCSPESPKGRRSLCYDASALASRKENKPRHNAVGMASEMGIELLTETQYLELQRLGNFDTKTSSWLTTPPEIREAGGALFGDRRYGRTFIYHNGAESYFASRGFRGLLRV